MLPQDRWEDADDDTLVRDDRLKHLGRVAREGLSGFTRSDGARSIT